MRISLTLQSASALGRSLLVLCVLGCGNEPTPGASVNPGAAGATANAAGATASAAGATTAGAASSTDEAGAGGHVGTNAQCCTTADPCGWANDGICDCSAVYGWDAADCGGDPSSGAPPNCCTEENLCNWQADGFCDCDYLYAWDAIDCENDVLECCTDDNECDWADDGLCNCGGIFDWDLTDCSLGSAPEGWTCATAYYEAVDGCDCGCGVPDPDCNTTALESCTYCWGSLAGGCSNFETQLCPGTIDPQNNAVCSPASEAGAPDAH